MEIRLTKPDVGEQEYEQVKKVLESGHLTEGPVTREFEEDVASYVGVRNAVAFSSCTTAIEVALRALDVGAGDEVLVSDYTYPATADVVCLLGAKPVFVDSDIRSYNMDAGELKAAITGKTKCVVAVSLFGHPLNEGVYEAAAERDIPIVEDAACSIGAMLNGGKVGCFADATCFSFHPRKLITTGEGGMLVTDDGELAAKASSFKHFGGELAGDGFSTCFKRLGSNYKLSDVLSAIGIAQLARIESIIRGRVERARIYDKLLAECGFCRAPEACGDVRHTYQTYSVLLDKEGVRDEVISSMRAAGIEVQIGTYALHMQPFFKDMGGHGGLGNAQYLFENSVALPLHNGLSDVQQQAVVDRLGGLMDGAG